MTSAVVAYLRLTRAHNCLAAALATGLGAYLNGAGTDEMWLLTRAAAIVALVVAAGNVVNDLLDLEVDRFAKPTRPLATGAVTARTAWWFLTGLVVTSAWLAAALPGHLRIFAIASLVSGLSYSFYLKSTVLVGNVFVAALSSATIVFGGLTAGSLTSPVIAATAIVFLFLVGREILKDVADHDGDEAMHITTVSTYLGRDVSLRLVTLFMAMFVLAANLPWLLGIADLWYLLVIWLAALAPTLGSVILMRVAPSPENVERALRVTKVAWFNGIAAMALLR